MSDHISDEDIKIAGMSADDRLLFEAGFVDVDGYPTQAGWNQLKKVVLAKHVDELIALVKKVRGSEVKED